MKRLVTVALLPVSVFSFLVLPNAMAAGYTLKVEVTVNEFEYFEGYDDAIYDQNQDGSPDTDYVPSKTDLASATKNCKAGYNDYKIGPNSRIKVNNESGKVVGLGNLTKVSLLTNLPGKETYLYFCKYSGSVKVGVAKFYKVLIDGRSGPDYSISELKSLKWQIKLEI
jgi:hypothetical protein